MYQSLIHPLFEKFRAFRADEEGAVTVDFVVLTSSVVLMGMAHAADVARGTTDISEAIENCLANDIAQVMSGTTSAEYLANLQSAESSCSNR